MVHYDPDQEQEVSAATLRVRSKIAKGARGGYAVEQTIELACPISHWVRDKATGEPKPMVVVGLNAEGGEVTTTYTNLYAAVLAQAGESLMNEVKRRQQAEGGLRITEEE